MKNIYRSFRRFGWMGWLGWLRWAGLLLLLPGCGLPPPKNAESRSIFFYAKQKLEQIQSAGYAGQVRGKVSALYEKVPYIIYALRGQSIKFVQQAAEPGPNSLLSSLGNGRYRLNRGVYMTMLDKNTMMSFDRKNWFAITGESATPIDEERMDEGRMSNVSFDLRFAVARESAQQLEVHYWAHLVLAPTLSYEQKNSAALSRRPLRNARRGDYITLKKGGKAGKGGEAAALELERGAEHYQSLMALRDGAPIALQQNTIFFAQGFEFYYRLYVLGNMLEAITEGPQTEVRFLRDIYFYYPRRLFAAISRDGQNWRDTVFRFRLAGFGSSVFLDGQSLQYADGIYIYRKD